MIIVLQGTYLFMSWNVLKGDTPHTFLDDLESFFYVMFYIAMTYTAPDCRKEELPDLLYDWNHYPLPSDAKQGFFLADSTPKVSVWFGAPIQNLLNRLHSIFKNILRQKYLAEYDGQPRPVVNRDEVYETMLSHIRQAIEDLGVEESEKPVEPAAPAPDDDLRNDDIFNSATEAGGNPGRPKHLSVINTAAASRPRRRQVKYGITKVGGFILVIR